MERGKEDEGNGRVGDREQETGQYNYRGDLGRVG